MNTTFEASSEPLTDDELAELETEVETALQNAEIWRSWGKAIPVQLKRLARCLKEIQRLRAEVEGLKEGYKATLDEFREYRRRAQLK